MKRGEFVFHKTFGLCCLVDFADKQDESVAVVAYELWAEPGSLRFGIVNATELTKIAVPPLVERMQKLILERIPYDPNTLPTIKGKPLGGHQ